MGYKTATAGTQQKFAVERMADAMIDPIMFCEMYLGLELYDYQKTFMRDKSKKIIVNSGRQIGKTTQCAAKAIHVAISISNQEILIVAPTQRQAGILFLRIKELIYGSQFSVILRTMIVRETHTQIWFSNGSKIYAVTSGYDGTKIKGYSPTLLLFDETALISDACFVNIEPSLAVTKGTVIKLSTPLMGGGAFYESWMDDDYSKHYIKSEQCPKITKKFLDKQREIMSEEDYLREYEAKFVMGTDKFFSRELVLKSIIRKEINENVKKNKKYYLGVDIARMGNNETVYMVLEMDEQQYSGKVIKIITETKRRHTHTAAQIAELVDIWGFERIYMDETTVGSGTCDIIHEIFEEEGVDKLILEPVTFDLYNKGEMYKNAKTYMEKGKLKIPDDQKLINQLLSMDYEYTSNRKLKIHAPPRMHDDMTDALVLVCRAFEEGMMSVMSLDVPEGVSLFD